MGRTQHNTFQYRPQPFLRKVLVTSMASRLSVTTTFEPERTIQPIYTGGDAVLDREGRILATCLGEEALLTDLSTGELLARIEGVGDILGKSMLPSLKYVIGWRGSNNAFKYCLKHFKRYRQC